MMGFLTLSELSKNFGKVKLLDHLSLTVNKGEILVIFGPSGAGKTVLLRLIAGVERWESGTMSLDGRDMTYDPPEHRGFGVAFQNFALFPHMTAFANIATPLIARKHSQNDIAEQVHKIAALLKIDQVLGHYPKQLSNGQKQRTALARALVARPALLLLDDPLRNVDAKLRFEMRLELPRLLRESGATVIYVTQDYREAMALGERIAIMMQGKLVQIDTPRGIYQHPATIKVAQLFGDPTLNLFNVTPMMNQAANEISVSLGGGELKLSGAVAAGLIQAVTDEKSLVLGIRPEDIDFVALGGKSAALSPSPRQMLKIKAKLAAITPLNERVVSFLTTSTGEEILCSRPATEGRDPTSFVQNEWVELGLALDKILIFGGQSGKFLAQVTAAEPVM
ncbi:MAG: ABC transporter ATP-binding protein, partial [Alphaproteobacteria bacterium]|nr:ABC transporter ATP-binding protein [Alphaproteobacteria bacterium]